MAQDTQGIPKWFVEYLERHDRWHSDFAQQNAREHGELARGISDSYGDLKSENRDLKSEISKAETRTTRWMASLILGGLTVAVAIIAVLINANGG